MGTLVKKTPAGLVVGVDGEMGMVKITPTGKPTGLLFPLKHCCRRRGMINIREKKLNAEGAVSTHLEEREVLIEE